MSDRERVIEAVKDAFRDWDDDLIAALVDLLFADDPEPMMWGTPDIVNVPMQESPLHTAWRHRESLRAKVLGMVER